MQTRVYRVNLFTWIFSIGLTLAGAYATADPINHLVTGAPWWISNGSHSHGSHIASQNETVIWTFGYGSILVIGIFFLIGSATRSITLDMDGIIVRGVGGMERFRERYEDLETAKMSESRKGKVFSQIVLKARDGQSVLIVDMYKGTDDLLDQLRQRAPQMVSILSDQ